MVDILSENSQYTRRAGFWTETDRYPDIRAGGSCTTQELTQNKGRTRRWEICLRRSVPVILIKIFRQFKSCVVALHLHHLGRLVPPLRAYKVWSFILLTPSSPTMAVDSRPSTADEKAPIPPPTPKGGFFSKFQRGKPASLDLSDEKSSQVTAITPPAEPEIPPVSFTQLFRFVSLASSLSIFSHLDSFSTRFELCIDAVAIVAAAAAGAAQVRISSSYIAYQLTSRQPLMTLLFGNLTNQFVKFQVVINNVDEGYIPFVGLQPLN